MWETFKGWFKYLSFYLIRYKRMSPWRYPLWNFWIIRGVIVWKSMKYLLRKFEAITTAIFQVTSGYISWKSTEYHLGGILGWFSGMICQANRRSFEKLKEHRDRIFFVCRTNIRVSDNTFENKILEFSLEVSLHRKFWGTLGIIEDIIEKLQAKLRGKLRWVA